MQRPAWRVLGILGLMLITAPASAQERVLHARPPRAERLSVDLERDLQLTLTGLYVAVAAELSHPAFANPGLVLPARGLNDLDRSVVGNHSALAATLSDGLLTANMTLPFIAVALDNLLGDDGLPGLGRDSLVLLETMSVSFIVCNVTKFAVRRPRPYLYDATTPLARRQANTATLSFFSGHTALAFSMATAYSYLFTLRHPDSGMVWPVWLLSHGAAATTAVMRVEGGKHFWTDVLAGAAVGNAVGLLVPYLHRGEGLSRLFGERSLLNDLRVTPVSYPGGGWGVNAMLFF